MNPLEVLELNENCTEEDVKRNFRRLSFLYHPDKHPEDKKSEESFKKLVNAYELIRNNPSLLNKKTPASYEDAIYAEIDATIKDLYFEMNKAVNLKRIIPCSTCRGSGTSNIHKGVCDLCKGTGQINNRILTMMKKSTVCPSCKGSGIKKEYLCTDCNGKKIKEEVKTYTFRLSLKNYTNKCVILNGEGNQYPYNHEGDVIIKLNIKEDPIYTVKNDKLCLDFNITPVQELIGDICEVSIFGKIIKFKVPVEGNRILINDKRKDFSHPRKILIKTILSKPVMDKEIKSLYEQILELEKNATSCS
jgi:DnaJ-class molecular chaperone